MAQPTLARTLDIADVQEYLHACRETVRQLRHRQNDPLVFFKVGRKWLIEEADFKDWVARQ
jgi:excisionase family DNA binding protein